jgi:alkylation response protein AidB-like acyl-CoA dehydrogenase
MTREELVARARALGPVLAERASKTEELRRLPEKTISAFRDAGLLRALVPKSHGGYQLPLGTVIETAREIGEHCGSSAWCLAICSLHNWMIGNFPTSAQDEVFGPSPDAVVCGVFMPGGAAHPTETGGYRLTGQWDFASGCDHASHAILAALVKAEPDGEVTGLGSFLVRREDFAIEDNWYVAGLEGTGSKRVIATDVFVPSEWTIALAKGSGAEAAGGTRGEAAPRESTSAAKPVPLPFNAVATLGLVGVSLGVARGALAGFRNRLATKVRVGTFRGVEAQVGAQYRLAESAVEIDGAELIALRDADEMERTAAAGEPASTEQRGRYRRDAAYVFQVCAKAVARLMPASGAHAVFRDATQQRALRDTQVMSTHIVADWDLARESYARALLGIPPEDPVF